MLLLDWDGRCYRIEVAHHGPRRWDVRACAVGASAPTVPVAWSIGETMDEAISFALQLLRVRSDRERQN